MTARRAGAVGTGGGNGNMSALGAVEVDAAAGGALFRPLSAEDGEQRPAEIESLCMNCFRNVRDGGEAGRPRPGPAPGPAGRVRGRSGRGAMAGVVVAAGGQEGVGRACWQVRGGWVFWGGAGGRAGLRDGDTAGRVLGRNTGPAGKRRPEDSGSHEAPRCCRG